MTCTDRARILAVLVVPPILLTPFALPAETKLVRILQSGTFMCAFLGVILSSHNLTLSRMALSCGGVAVVLVWCAMYVSVSVLQYASPAHAAAWELYHRFGTPAMALATALTIWMHNMHRHQKGRLGVLPSSVCLRGQGVSLQSQYFQCCKCCKCWQGPRLIRTIIFLFLLTPIRFVMEGLYFGVMVSSSGHLWQAVPIVMRPVYSFGIWMLFHKVCMDSPSLYYYTFSVCPAGRWAFSAAFNVTITNVRMFVLSEVVTIASVLWFLGCLLKPVRDWKDRVLLNPGSHRLLSALLETVNFAQPHVVSMLCLTLLSQLVAALVMSSQQLVAFLPLTLTSVSYYVMLLRALIMPWVANALTLRLCGLSVLQACRDLLLREPLYMGCMFFLTGSQAVRLLVFFSNIFKSMTD